MACDTKLLFTSDDCSAWIKSGLLIPHFQGCMYVSPRAAGSCMAAVSALYSSITCANQTLVKDQTSGKNVH